MEKVFDDFKNETVWRMKFIRFFRRMKEAPFWQAELLAFALAVIWFRVSVVSVLQNSPAMFDWKAFFIFYKNAIIETEIVIQTLVAVCFFAIGFLMVSTAKALTIRAPRFSLYRIPFVGRIRF